MKRLIALVLISFFLLTPLIVLAKEDRDISTSTRDMVRQRLIETREGRQQVLDTVRERNQVRNEEKKANLTEARKGRIREFGARLVTRLKASISRLEKLIERINARLDILAEEGQDVASIKADVASASQLVSDASTTLSTIEETWEEMLESNDSKEVFSAVKDSIADIKSNLIEAHRILVHVIGDIKGLRVGTTKEE